MRRTVTGNAFIVLTMLLQIGGRVNRLESQSSGRSIRDGRASRQTVGKHTELLPIAP